MSELKIAICIEADIRQCSMPADPLMSFLKVDGYRRQLEDFVVIRQLSQGLFTASLDDKEAVYCAIEGLEAYASSNSLSVRTFLIQSLEDEQQRWLKLKNAPPWEKCQGASADDGALSDKTYEDNLLHSIKR